LGKGTGQRVIVYEMKNVLVTGASGFIGSFLVEEGLRRGMNVYAGIRKTSPRNYLTDPRIRFIEFDFSSREKIISVLKECRENQVVFHHIIHNAGITKSGKKDAFFSVNYQNTRNFIEALIDTGSVPEKFIFISSLAAFGPGNPETMAPVRLSDEPHPIEIYGRSKLEAEKFIASLKEFPWIILRPTGVYGPREKDYYVFFQTIGRGLETYIGRTTQVLTFIYVRDLVRLTFDILFSAVSRRSYFVADGKEYTTTEFAAITKKVMGKKTVRLTVPAGLVKSLAWMLEKLFGLWDSAPTLNTDKYNVLVSRNWRCEVEPLKRDFNFAAEYDLEKGIRETIAWYRDNGWL
jgi:nucleoside-diphosphate-sugar epimerase